MTSQRVAFLALSCASKKFTTDPSIRPSRGAGIPKDGRIGTHHGLDYLTPILDLRPHRHGSEDGSLLNGHPALRRRYRGLLHPARGHNQQSREEGLTQGAYVPGTAGLGYGPNPPLQQ